MARAKTPPPRPACPTCKRGLPPQWPRKKALEITGAAKLDAVLKAARGVIEKAQHANGVVYAVAIDAVLDLELAVRDLDIAQGRAVDDREEMPF